MAELDVQSTPEGPVVVSKVDGKDARFLLDTGSWTDAVFTPAVQRLGLNSHGSRIEIYGVGGPSPTQEVTVADWQVGGLTGHDVQLLVIPSSHAGVDGLIGASLLLKQDLEFDLRNGKVRLFRPSGCSGDQVVYWGQAYASVPLEPRPGGGAAVIVPVQINGVTVRAEIDSGSSRSIVDLATARAAGARPLEPEGPHAGYVIGPRPLDSRAVAIDSFGFGDEAIRATRLLSGDLFRAAKEERVGSHIAVAIDQDQPRMLLGYDFLRAHRVYIATSQRRVYVSYEGGQVFNIERLPTAVAPPVTPPP